MTTTARDNKSDHGHGLMFAIGAYLTWGLSPIYFKFIKHIPPFEIVMHRMLWSLVLLIPLVVVSGRWSEFTDTLRNRRTLAVLGISTIIIGSNWLLYIWAINTDRILQASLGYYVTPLVNILLGMIFLRERLRPLQFTAVGLAAVGVLYLTVQYGEFPWIALALALTFGFYGLIRKVASVGAMVGLTTELSILFLPALAYVVHLGFSGRGALLNIDRHTDFLLAGSALVTGLPLLLFISGARRLHLSTIGFLQFTAPTCTFLLAVFVYHEPLAKTQLMAFVLIWTALAVFSLDSLRQYHRNVVRRPVGAPDSKV